MDRGRRLARFLIAGAAAFPAAAAEAPSLPIREARWTAPDRVWAALRREPAECYAAPRNAERRRSAEIGRALFRAPLLLGGQAARAGLSCASCHRSGRGNPDFVFPGLSGPPGTADVTSSLLSSHRGDGAANPKPIPDLATAAPKVSRDRASRSLEGFIRGLVVEEFDGAEPPQEVLTGLADYVRALGPERCGARADPLEARLAAVDRSTALAASAEGETRRLLIAAARSALGEIEERFRLPGLESTRERLRAADRGLHAVQGGRPSLAEWRRRWPERRRRIAADASRSLFDPALLRRALAEAGGDLNRGRFEVNGAEAK